MCSPVKHFWFLNLRIYIYIYIYIIHNGFPFV